MSLTSFPTTRLFRFIRKRSGPFDGEVTLDSRRVYILPTRSGLMFGMLLLLLLVGSINYEKSLGYALTFLLAGIGNVGIFTTWKNLRGLVLRAGGAAPVFAGERANFMVRCFNPDDDDRRSIVVSHADREFDVADIPAGAHAGLGFSVAADARGMLAPGPCKISTEFPFGLFIAWTWVDLDMRCVVYPAPAVDLPDTRPTGDDSGEGELAGAGQEIFEGLRSYQQGDSYKRVSWKSYARNQELMIKQYSGGAPVEQWIDWEQAAGADIETRLRILCRLVLDADERGTRFGLRMPGLVIEPERGPHHRHRCLRELALYGAAADAG